MKKKSTQRLIFYNDTLSHTYPHFNYLSYCQRIFHLQDHPSPLGHGWDIVNGKCRPVRYTLPALPTQISTAHITYPDSSDEESMSEDSDNSTDTDQD